MKILYLLLLSGLSFQVMGQDHFVEALALQKQSLQQEHQKNYGKIRHLLNGRQHIALYHFTLGHPFYERKSWYDGSVKTRLYTYPHLTLRYDVYRDALIYLPDSLIQETIWINEDQVLSFSLENTLFINLGLEDELAAMEAAEMEPGYYELMYSGKTHLFRKYRKELKSKSGDPRAHSEFYEKKMTYVYHAGSFFRIKKKKDLLRAFPTQKDAIRTYLRQKKIFVKKIHDAQFINLLRFYESL